MKWGRTTTPTPRVPRHDRMLILNRQYLWGSYFWRAYSGRIERITWVVSRHIRGGVPRALVHKHMCCYDFEARLVGDYDSVDDAWAFIVYESTKNYYH